MSQIQLVSRGDLDTFLTGNPSITFFKSVYRKHTNFSMEDMIIATIPKPILLSGKYAIKIPTGTGDLLYGTNLILRGNKVYCGNGIANISTAVIDNIAFSIGNREIDRTYGHYLEVYHELNQENPNSTITNLGRIEDSSLYHIGHNADMATLASIQNTNENHVGEKNYPYIDNSLAKPTNIMGSGLGYPPTHFQRSSKCGGTYCSPTYLQEQNNTNSATHLQYENNNLISTINTRPISNSYLRSRVGSSVTGTVKIPSVGITVSGSLTVTITIDGGSDTSITVSGYIGTYSTANQLVEALNSGIQGGNKDKIKFSHINGYIRCSIITYSTGFTPSTIIISGGDTTSIFGATPNTIVARDNMLIDKQQIDNSMKSGDIIGECILPLNFWYCRSPGQALPLIALHKGVEVELYIKFADPGDADWTSDSAFDDIDSYITYDPLPNTRNDIRNAYNIGGNSNNLKAIVDSTTQNFQFDMNISVIYIFLDNMERQRFQNSAHEYLIEQLQYHRHNSSNKIIDISAFHHPIKELIWTGQPYISNLISSNDGTNFSDLNTGVKAHKSGVRFVSGNTGSTIEDDVLYGGGIKNDDTKTYSIGFDDRTSPYSSINNDRDVKASNLTNITNGKYVQGLLGPSTPDCLDYCSYKIVLNGTDRCQYKPLQYFTRENVRKYHKGGCVSVPDSIAVFSFALNPNDTAPSGTCNFTNIDLKQIHRNINSDDFKKINVYAINYNILRVVNGQAGLSYVL
uniref:Major capsid protein N-terminal domain-containing protein n=1 Tax=viral metagenome TaxID=1070528 RepID=A0A6C0C823_9ZZZZ